LPNEADKAEANDANKAKAYEVDKAIVANAANEVNVINEIIVANIKHSSKLIKYSLTKCSRTFARMKEYFGIMISNFLNLRFIRICSRRYFDNQLGLNFGANVSNTVDKVVGVADMTNKLDELAVAKGSNE
jgi:hypothetical protein